MNGFLLIWFLYVCLVLGGLVLRAFEMDIAYCVLIKNMVHLYYSITENELEHFRKCSASGRKK